MTDAPPQTDGAPDDTPPPGGLAADVFDIAALVNSTKTTFELEEATAIKVVDLALTYRLATKQLNAQFGPPPDAVLRADEPSQ